MTDKDWQMAKLSQSIQQDVKNVLLVSDNIMVYVFFYLIGVQALLSARA